MSLIRETLKSKSKYDRKEITISYYSEIIPISYIHHIKDRVVRTTDKIDAANIYDIIDIARNTVVLVTNTKSGINLYPVFRTTFKYSSDFPEIYEVLDIDSERRKDELVNQMYVYYNELESMCPLDEDKLFENTSAYLRTGRMKQNSPKLWGGDVEGPSTVEIKDNIDDTLDGVFGTSESKEELDIYGWRKDAPYFATFKMRMNNMQRETAFGPGEILEYKKPEVLAESNGRKAMEKLKMDTTGAKKGRGASKDESSFINTSEAERMMCGGNPHISGDSYMGIPLMGEDMEEIGGIEDND